MTSIAKVLKDNYTKTSNIIMQRCKNMGACTGNKFGYTIDCNSSKVTVADKPCRIVDFGVWCFIICKEDDRCFIVYYCSEDENEVGEVLAPSDNECKEWIRGSSKDVKVKPKGSIKKIKICKEDPLYDKVVYYYELI
ncbi:hypothetical protein E3E38_03945 [Thermococcus sp. 18S1]|uniref:hypothetical protein n=1 Tax=Thermococcus sp. 18S1 TaxID=1638210 RepID=UPI0014386E19|nr:hypothetical protein [Thermococcus sp. 18S1]NJE30204.1 hypothetical protein [Thermococcus sp. 18S1]